MEGRKIWESILILTILVVSIGLFGAGYGLVINLVSKDTYEKIKGQLSTIFIVNSVFIIALAVLCYMLIQSDPSMFQPYILISTHLSLLISLLSLSYTVLRVTN